MKLLNYISENFRLSMMNEIKFCSRRVPELKIRLAGKSIPLEKYAMRQCEHFHAQQWLFLPALVTSDIYIT
jgi:hypothetical protein